MAQRDDVQVLIASKHNKWIHNSADDSWYSENFTGNDSSEDRPSFHYPNLERWLLMATRRYERRESKYNPFKGKNFTFVFHDNQTTGTPLVTISENVMNYARRVFKSTENFIVYMFDYDLNSLSVMELQQIFAMIHGSFTTHSYTDPLGVIRPILLSAQVKPSPKPTKESSTKSTLPKSKIKNKKLKKKNEQRINESQLRAIVAESVKKALKQYGILS